MRGPVVVLPWDTSFPWCPQLGQNRGPTGHRAVLAKVGDGSKKLYEGMEKRKRPASSKSHKSRTRNSVGYVAQVKSMRWCVGRSALPSNAGTSCLNYHKQDMRVHRWGATKHKLHYDAIPLIAIHGAWCFTAGPQQKRKIFFSLS